MTSDFPIADLANNLIRRLDRTRIFPPYHNNPEDLLPVLNASRTCHPRRSPNSFLLCRKNVHEEAKRNGTFNMRIVSKVTGILWRKASAREKQFYEDLAKRCNSLYVERYHSIYGRQSTTHRRPLAPYQDPVPPPPPLMQVLQPDLPTEFTTMQFEPLFLQSFPYYNIGLYSQDFNPTYDSDDMMLFFPIISNNPLALDFQNI
ncbi:5376_t:CDS:2 [Racocetra persica]|uniref:5376_t:CDS:1 n=1 Tax=Racocetra persica TaxID=160502 RepID=A0ACA9K7T4_9GLOM|nr:5376_t:CDS:2 [Racocetra persica]